VTQMVREFPELQGIAGGIYAQLDGEPAPVAEAIREQYLPRGPVLPKTPVGAYLALLDKLDSLLGALAAGLAVSGSEDPYGVRRVAQGIVAIVLDRKIRLNLRKFVAEAAPLQVTHFPHTSSTPQERPFGSEAGEAQFQLKIDAVVDAAMDLLRQRLRTVLIDSGISYDTVDAVLAAGGDDLVDGAERARALWAFRKRPEFMRLYTAYDRASRILPPRFHGQVKQDALEAPAERHLLSSLEEAQPRVLEARMAGRYDEALADLAGLADPVDRFFTDVMVMADDEGVRANRLALLARVVELIRPLADLSRAVVGEGTPRPDS
jgi:glycyl-tRNA synthetase beta chain